MADINKTIKALTEWIEDPNAMNAEIDGSLVSDALKLLKEQHEAIKSLEQEIRDKNVRLTERAEQVERLLKKSVPQSVVDQIRWERDTALSQLKEIGKCLGEKMDDVKPKTQQPKKVLYKTNPWTNLPVSFCPNCEEAIKMYEYGHGFAKRKYCSYCGQAIDWDGGEQE